MIVWLLVVLFLFAGVLALHWHKKKKLRNSLAICLCLNKLKRLKNLLIHIQRHRGLSCACLQGDQHVKGTIQRLSHDLDEQWSRLAADYPDLLEDSLFEGVHSHWHRLKVRWQSLQLKNNIDQHNRLINNLLFLIENHAEQHIELNRFSRTTGLDVIWKELLETIEAIGQTRAIGVGMVAAKISSPIERIQLKFLIEKLNRRLTDLDNALGDDKVLCVQSHGIHMHWSQALIQDARRNANELTRCITNNLITDKTIYVSTDEFFKLASDAIEPLNQIFDKTSELLINAHSGKDEFIR